MRYYTYTILKYREKFIDKKKKKEKLWVKIKSKSDHKEYYLFAYILLR